jgi:hypothetical protein
MRNYNVQKGDYQPGQIVSVIQFDKGKPAVRSEVAGTKNHPSYEAVLLGKPIGVLTEKVMISDFFKDFFATEGTQPASFTRKVQTKMPEFKYGEGSSVIQGRPLTDVNFQPTAPDTPAFKKWFGDSKVVDADGQPKIYYHGTNSEFNAFEKKKRKEGLYGKAFYFSEDPKEAAGYGKKVIPVYLQADQLFKGLPLPSEINYEKSIAYQRGKSVWVFEPTQIKLATGNAGTFDAANPDIRFMPSVEFSAPEKLPNGQAWSTDNKYRVIQKEGGKYRVYAPTGTLIGVADTLDKSKKLIEKRSR